MIKTKEEILKKHILLGQKDMEVSKNNDFECEDYKVIEKYFGAAMEEYSERQCDLIRELYTKPNVELLPLAHLWCEENSIDKFSIPMETFYKWIRIKILGK